jgi:CHAT domain-containing protein
MKTALLLALLILIPPAHAAYNRNPLEEKLAQWSNTRSSGSDGPGYLLWQLVQMKDFSRNLRTINGTINQYTVLNGLIRVRSAVDYYAQQGDLELAHAVVHAANDQRLEWLASDFAQTNPRFRYMNVHQRTKDYEPYLEPLKLGSADLLIDASMQFKGYAIDYHLAWETKRNMLTPAQRTMVDKISALQTQRDLHHKTLQLKPKRGGEAAPRKIQADSKIKFDQVTKELGQYSHEEIMLSSTWVNQGVIPSITEIRSLIDRETLVIDIVQARSLTDKPYSINAWDRRIYAGAAFDQSGTYGPVNMGDTKPIDALIKAITTGMRSPTDQPDPALVANATKLRQLVIDPFLRHAVGKTKLLISLDGELLFAPIPMLPDANGEFLTNQYEVSFFDSYRQLANLSSHRSNIRPRSSLLVGDPIYLSEALEKQLGEAANPRYLSQLPGTREEVDQVTTVLLRQDKSPLKLLGAQATESAFRAGLAQPQEFIHVATHGGYTQAKGDLSPSERARLTFAYSEDTPRKQGSAIADSPSNDGIFQAKDIASYDLTNTRLVMLSACDTGLGESVQGDIVQGFRGAFFMAGTPQVMITMSPVNDSIAPILMNLFYSYSPLLQSDVTAWTEAMRALLKYDLFKDKAAAIKLMGPFYFVTHRPAHAKFWPVGPVRGFINWRRPFSSTSEYIEALHGDSQVGLYLTPQFHQRLKMVDSSQFGLIPTSAVVSKVVVEGDLAFVKINTQYQAFIFTMTKAVDGQWLIDDIVEAF